MKYDFIKKSQRQIEILNKLEKTKEIIKKKDMALMFDVSERTIIRDMKSIINENHNIMVICGKNGGYRYIKEDNRS